jgi:hypothetical protein
VSKRVVGRRNVPLFPLCIDFFYEYKVLLLLTLLRVSVLGKKTGELQPHFYFMIIMLMHVNWVHTLVIVKVIVMGKDIVPDVIHFSTSTSIDFPSIQIKISHHKRKRPTSPQIEQESV